MNSWNPWHHIAWTPCRACLIRSRIYFHTTKPSPRVNQTHFLPSLLFFTPGDFDLFGFANFPKKYNEPYSKTKVKCITDGESHSYGLALSPYTHILMGLTRLVSNWTDETLSHGFHGSTLTLTRDHTQRNITWLTWGLWQWDALNMNDTETEDDQQLAPLDSVSFLSQRHITVPSGSPDKSSVLPVECWTTKCGQHGSLEIPITNVELLEMTFTAASHMNTAAELRASVAQLWANSAHCLLRLNGGNWRKSQQRGRNA